MGWNYFIYFWTERANELGGANIYLWAEQACKSDGIMLLIQWQSGMGCDYFIYLWAERANKLGGVDIYLWVEWACKSDRIIVLIYWRSGMGWDYFIYWWWSRQINQTRLFYVFTSGIILSWNCQQIRQLIFTKTWMDKIVSVSCEEYGTSFWSSTSPCNLFREHHRWHWCMSSHHWPLPNAEIIFTHCRRFVGTCIF